MSKRLELGLKNANTTGVIKATSLALAAIPFRLRQLISKTWTRTFVVV